MCWFGEMVASLFAVAGVYCYGTIESKFMHSIQVHISACPRRHVPHVTSIDQPTPEPTAYADAILIILWLQQTTVSSSIVARGLLFIDQLFPHTSALRLGGLVFYLKPPSRSFKLVFCWDNTEIRLATGWSSICNSIFCIKILTPPVVYVRTYRLKLGGSRPKPSY